MERRKWAASAGIDAEDVDYVRVHPEEKAVRGIK
jgi:hypothetical protein